MAKRLFFGIDIPGELKHALGSLQRTLKNAGVEAGNWSNSNLFHVTVVFLGELPPESLDACRQIGEAGTKGITPFTLRLKDIGMFPKNKILWVGIEHDAGFSQLEQLNRQVSAETARRELVKLETRPYRPHLTLARKLDTASMKGVDTERVLDQVAHGWEFPVTELSLFESTRVNGELVYPIVDQFPFH